MTPTYRQGLVLWFTGLSGSGKTTLARLLEKELCHRGFPVEVLDGDEFRAHLSRDLGYSRQDRETNMRRIGFVSEMLKRHRVMAIVAAISPYRNVRDEIRANCNGRFVEVHLKCPLDILIQRDSKGLYRRAMAGEIENFTGISDPYEEPLQPEIIVETSCRTPEDCHRTIINRLEELEYL